jgi:hypothetical protein
MIKDQRITAIQRTMMEIWRRIMENWRMPEIQRTTMKIQRRMIELQTMMTELQRTMIEHQRTMTEIQRRIPVSSYSLVCRLDLINQKMTAVSLRLPNSLLTTCLSFKDVLPKRTNVLAKQSEFT